MRHEGIKAKTLGRRYPKGFLPNAPQALSTKAFQAKREGVRVIFDATFSGVQDFFFPQIIWQFQLFSLILRYLLKTK